MLLRLLARDTLLAKESRAVQRHCRVIADHEDTNTESFFKICGVRWQLQLRRLVDLLRLRQQLV